MKTLLKATSLAIAFIAINIMFAIAGSILPKYVILLLVIIGGVCLVMFVHYLARYLEV